MKASSKTETIFEPALSPNTKNRQNLLRLKQSKVRSELTFGRWNYLTVTLGIDSESEESEISGDESDGEAPAVEQDDFFMKTTPAAAAADEPNDTDGDGESASKSPKSKLQNKKRKAETALSGSKAKRSKTNE